MSVCEITMSFPSRVSPLDRFQPNVIILKTAVSHRGTETTEAPDKELYRRKALKNCHPLGGDTASENPPFHLLCALLKLSHSFNSVAISTALFRVKPWLAKPQTKQKCDRRACRREHMRRRILLPG